MRLTRLAILCFLTTSSLMRAETTLQVSFIGFDWNISEHKIGVYGGIRFVDKTNPDDFQLPFSDQVFTLDFSSVVMSNRGANIEFSKKEVELMHPFFDSVVKYCQEVAGEKEKVVSFFWIDGVEILRIKTLSSEGKEKIFYIDFNRRVIFSNLETREENFKEIEVYGGSVIYMSLQIIKVYTIDSVAWWFKEVLPKEKIEPKKPEPEPAPASRNFLKV